MNTINNTLRNVIGPILQGINSAMSAAQQIMGAIFDFQRNVVYPQQAIDRARALIGQVQGIYNAIRGIWNIVVRSATLPNPRQLEAVILSRDPAQIGSLAGSFSAVYTPLPPADGKPGEIRIGLSAIRNVGENVVAEIIRERGRGGPFKTFADFCHRVDPTALNKRVIESFVKAGAFDSLKLNRAARSGLERPAGSKNLRPSRRSTSSTAQSRPSPRTSRTGRPSQPRTVQRAAPMDVPVLITGESGTGKELIARAIHASSRRVDGPFISVSCGALPENLLESELFGHVKGAFTGALAARKGLLEASHGGTFFLDEIGEAPLSIQVKLLRVLEERSIRRLGDNRSIPVDARIVAATNRDLQAAVREKIFREDLYYRLNVVPIRMPPLRERRNDIPLLVAHFIEKTARKVNKQVSGLSPQAMSLLTGYRWPGNVRELENIIQRMIVVTKGDTLDVEDLPSEILGKEEFSKKAVDLKDITRGSAGLAEKKLIVDALDKSGGNVTLAARSLGVSRVTLQKKMKIYNLREPSRQDPSG